MDRAPGASTGGALREALVIRHHVEDDAGLIGEALAARGFSVDTRMLDANHATPELGDADVLVVLGSNCSTYDEEARESWFQRELVLMAEADRRGVGVLGICFGAQALCELAGGHVVPAPEPEIGWYDIEVESGVSFEPGPWFEYHFDACVLPDTTRVLARSAAAVQAFTWGRHLGVQFHPEIDVDMLGRWLASPSSDPRAAGLDESALLERTRNEAPAARERAAWLVGFFLEHFENSSGAE